MASKQFVVARGEAFQRLTEWLHRHLGFSRGQARGLLKAGVVWLDGRPCSDGAHRLRPGQKIRIDAPTRSTPAPGDDPKKPRPPKGEKKPKTVSFKGPLIYHVDEHVVVVSKPAGMTTVRHAAEAAEFGERGRKYLPTTLAEMLPSMLANRRKGGPPGKVRAVHRLDRDTSGLVVFARTRAAEANLGEQFRAHTVQRRYLAVVRGKARDARIESWLVPDRGDGRRGSGDTPGKGQRAVTHVRVVEDLGDYTLVECQLETGRTHQVRIHLGEAGTPLCGERVYDRPPNGKPLPDGSGAKRTALHAATLGFTHPATGELARWTEHLPRDMEELVERLRRQYHHEPEA